jgi:branched-chain amino acid transport system permease protein
MTLVLLTEVYAIVSMSLNLLLGVAGRFSAYEAAVMGVGAYTAALFAQRLGLDLMVGCIAGALACAVLGMLFQVATRYMDFFTFKITSFALQMTLWQTFVTWRDMTGGSNGLYGVPRPELFGISFDSLTAYFWLETMLAAVLISFFLYIERSQFALALRGMRDGEQALASLGKNVFLLKLKVFAISGAATGFAGGLLAGLLQSVSPNSFYVYVSVVFIVFVTAGGRGNLKGTLLAVVGLTVVQEFIQLIPNLPTTYIGPLQQIFYAGVLIAVILYRPKGLLPEKPIFLSSQLRHKTTIPSGFGFLDEPRMP